MAEELQNLYAMAAGNTWRSRYAYAIGYTPLADRKSFIRPEFEEAARQFAELNHFKPGIRISREGSKWPDGFLTGADT